MVRRFYLDSVTVLDGALQPYVASLIDDMSRRDAVSADQRNTIDLVMQRGIQFFFRGKVITVSDVPITYTVLQWLREGQRAVGTKEGCAEGDCGACTVVLGELNKSAKDGVALFAVNSCIQFLATLDGKALFTVEDLASAGPLHPVQQAMVDCHGSQCGFCTPGFVMSLWADYENRRECPTRDETLQVLAGNLCRCTGYRPILDAAVAARRLPRPAFDRAHVRQELEAMAELPPLQYAHAGEHFWAPRTLDEVALLRARHPDALLLAGCTDVGLWVTKQLRALGQLIYLGQIDELRLSPPLPDWLLIGAGVTLTDAFDLLVREEPHWSELAQRFASPPVRNAGTLGGNIANASPIGDATPGLLALHSHIVLQSATRVREIALEDFFIAYRQTALLREEVLTCVKIPRVPKGMRRVFRIWKVSKRFDQDISAVCGAFALELSFEGIIVRAGVAFGGMAPIPKRASTCEAALLGRPWNAATARAAIDALMLDYEPMSDMRATRNYRMQVSKNLLLRFHYETGVDRVSFPVRLPDSVLTSAGASS
jgi:xanthine dehydrogenase small subunit